MTLPRIETFYKFLKLPPAAVLTGVLFVKLRARVAVDLTRDWCEWVQISVRWGLKSATLNAILDNCSKKLRVPSAPSLDSLLDWGTCAVTFVALPGPPQCFNGDNEPVASGGAGQLPSCFHKRTVEQMYLFGFILYKTGRAPIYRGAS
jgi:hypothetical protein